MMVSEYVAYLNSAEGRAALRQAAALLHDPSPEFGDAKLVEMVEALGFPRWAALRVFHQCTHRFSPLICCDCAKEFRPRARSTIDRPWCAQCDVARKGPEAVKKHRARAIASHAEQNGRLKRRPCERCGFDHDIHKHHPDYSRPLHVIWLCCRCHAAEHKNLNKVSRGKLSAAR